MKKYTFEEKIAGAIAGILIVAVSIALVLYGSFRCNKENTFDQSGVPVVVRQQNV